LFKIITTIIAKVHTSLNRAGGNAKRTGDQRRPGNSRKVVY
jgi:hypothetical protein